MSTSKSVSSTFDEDLLARNLHTLRDYIRFSLTLFEKHDVFMGHGTDNAWDEAVFLVLRSLSLPWDTKPDVLDARLLPEEKVTVINNIERRVFDRVPLSYILGEAVFMGLSFKVDERVLIPRSPIAELIEEGFMPWIAPQDVHSILDLCTGSGCIGIASAYQFPEAIVDLVDLSEEALVVAEQNIVQHGLQQQVKIICSDVFNSVDGVYDVIVSNPPYVDKSDFDAMPAEFSHEPRMGLVAGDDGLDIVRRMLKEGRQYLTDHGIMIVEVGNSWVALEEAYPDIHFNWIEFEHGGGGVFIITAEELDLYADQF